MRLVLVIVMMSMVACVAAGEPARRNRWPKHREQKDQQIEELLQRVSKLEKDLAETREYVSKLHVKKKVPETPPVDAGPAPAPPPPSGNLPQSGGATP
jgi:septal ring factor EnvC (AmiA/AmiB activator)